jgi:hypothetical protein
MHRTFLTSVIVSHGPCHACRPVPVQQVYQVSPGLPPSAERLKHWPIRRRGAHQRLHAMAIVLYGGDKTKGRFSSTHRLLDGLPDDCALRTEYAPGPPCGIRLLLCSGAEGADMRCSAPVLLLDHTVWPDSEDLYFFFWRVISRADGDDDSGQSKGS